MTMIDTNVSRRSLLAGLGGMTFCIALGNDGVRLMSQARATRLGERAGDALGAHRARRQDHHSQRRRRNGPGLDDLAAAHRGRGDGRRLVEGRDRMDPGRRQDLRLQEPDRDRAADVDRRQPRGAALFQPAAHGWRAGAQGADRQCRAEMGGRPRHAAHRAERRDQSRQWPTPELWRDRRVRNDSRDAARGRCERAQGPQGFPADRKIPAAPRHAGQGQRHGAIRHRREAAGDGLCLDAALAGSQRAKRSVGSGQAGPIRRGAGELERRRGQGHERRARDRRPGERARRRRRSFRERQGRPRRPQGQVAESQGRGLRLRARARRLRQDPRRSERAGG